MSRVEEFYEAMQELIGVTAKIEGFSWGSFLLDSVQKCADEETLTKMIVDIREYTKLVKSGKPL